MMSLYLVSDVTRASSEITFVPSDAISLSLLPSTFTISGLTVAASNGIGICCDVMFPKPLSSITVRYTGT